MKFVCHLCGKTFMHPAKKTTNKLAFSTDGTLMTVESSFEEHVCPNCKGNDYDEIPEEVSEKKTVGICEVPVEEADRLLKLNEGWVITQDYAKGVRMRKYAEAV